MGPTSKGREGMKGKGGKGGRGRRRGTIPPHREIVDPPLHPRLW